MIPDDTPYFLTRENLGDISGVFYIPKPSPFVPPVQKRPSHWPDVLLGSLAGFAISLAWYFTR